MTADAPAPAAASALFASPERMAEFVAMREFVAATLEFEYQHARFETLAGVRGGTWQDATALFSYLFGLKLNPGTSRSVTLFDRAVRDSTTGTNGRERQHDATRFRKHLKVLHRAWLEHLFGANELATLQRELVRGVRALAANPNSESGELAGLQADIGKLRTLLARTDVAWMADGRLARAKPMPTWMRASASRACSARTLLASWPTRSWRARRRFAAASTPTAAAPRRCWPMPKASSCW
ncbi:hypothetical protein G4G28_13600 [Massilia sp. Dwa41.01b]|uniref:hypothetical protein n=1 Tax=Massilia sp. Dwa41.01b TaxID=2709302 RepID=UPI0016026584|nr:hypothetical protein [Massilia sp. Dwa41.01b]QNA87229.1 hypothetical protein G4G28_13600 [Massilia sp. Dwa41.01b]